MPVEIRHLRILLAVVDAGSMSRAAEKLGVTQPSVTRAMSELEQQLGTELLDRAGRRATPTAAGRQFTTTARRIVADFDSAMSTPFQSPTLRIAYSWAALTPAVERILRTWNGKSRSHSVELVRFGSPLSALSTSAADLALIREWTAQPGYRHIVIDEEPRVAAVSSDDPLAAETAIAFTDLAEYGLVLNTNSGTTPDDLWGHSRNRRRDRTTTDVEDWVTTIATTPGVFGLTPSSTADFYRHPALTYLTLRGAPPVTSSLIWLDDRTASVAAFAEHALNQTGRN
ncbi:MULTISPECIES: LysR family transcriptional regulator [Nocardiaceae]|uniref:LysR family transcriptional regulator n=1 Tax=Nocardiaceae TaxID=85025 RepID=UPI0011400BFA|nr:MULTISPECIES: LysR family transcriptional regulator [Rhodococcus]